MKHVIILSRLPEGVSHEAMQSFNIVRKNTILPEGASVMETVGLRYAGWFRTVNDCDEKEALSALKYGLMQAQYSIGSSNYIDYETLFTKRREELIQAANTALEESESSVRLADVLFSYVEYCVHDGSLGRKNQQYMGIMIGSSGSHTVIHSKADREGQWQCVCGAFSGADEQCCSECGTSRPVYEDPALEP